MADLPCKNTSCKSYGTPHPNCKCYGPMADGGHVDSYCSKSQEHQTNCPFYMAVGGEVPTPSQPPVPFPQVSHDPKKTIGHSVISNGLLGVLSKAGKSNMLESPKHQQMLEDAQNQHQWRSVPKELALPKTQGVRLGDHIANGDHESAADHMHGHSLVGSAQKGHLKEIMQRLAEPLIKNQPNPSALRGSVDYLSSGLKGKSNLEDYAGKMLGYQKVDEIEPDLKAREDLKEHLKSVRANPDSLLDIGGNLSHYLPDDAVQVAQLAGNSSSYLNSIEPKPSQMGQLDPITPPSAPAVSNYNRQLDIANQPLLALQHLKHGSLVPQDLNTIKTLYPGLYDSFKKHAFDQMVDAKTNQMEIPHHQKIGLSMLMGQPLRSTLTPQSMQAIQQSNSTQQQSSTKSGAPGKPKKASGVELKQIDKVNDMYQTTLQARSLDKKD